MEYGSIGGELLRLLQIKRRVFVSYHHDLDQSAYDYLSFVLTEVYETCADRSLDRIVDSTDPGYVMRRIREGHITGTSCTIVLCGAETYQRKYVDWEIKATLDKQHGLVGVTLPGVSRSWDGKAVVPSRLHENIVTGYAPFVGWSDITRDAARARAIIEEAIARPKDRIVSAGALKSRNG